MDLGKLQGILHDDGDDDDDCDDGDEDRNKKKLMTRSA